MLLCFLLLAFPLKGQNVDLQTYWNDVDFNDTTLIPTNVLTTRILLFVHRWQ